MVVAVCNFEPDEKKQGPVSLDELVSCKCQVNLCLLSVAECSINDATLLFIHLVLVEYGNFFEFFSFFLANVLPYTYDCCYE